MASENRPGVIITQALAETVAVTADPSLVPVVMAPCYQIVNALLDDGSLNSSAKYSSKYNQASLTIEQGNFPDPRSNIDELDIDESSVEVFISRAGGLTELQKGSNGSTGTSFLQRIPGIYRPAVRFNQKTFSITAPDTSKTLVVAIDAGNVNDTTGDITITFDSLVTNVTQAAAVINAASQAALGIDIAVVDATFLHIVSPSYGPGASITFRAGSSALVDGYLDNGMTSAADYYRVEGAGLAAQLISSEASSSYIEFRVATAYVGSTTPESQLPAWAGSITSSTAGSM